MTTENFIHNLVDVFEKEADDIKLADAFRDYDEWDSITLLSLVAMLEDEYGVTIPRAKFIAIETLQEMYDYVLGNK